MEHILTTIPISELKQLITVAVQEGFNGLQYSAKPDPEDRIDVCEACNITGYSKATIYKMTFTGEIPFQKFGKRLVFSRQELSDWIRDRTKSSKSLDSTVTDQLCHVARKRRAG